jgi:hypothetical protein
MPPEHATQSISSHESLYRDGTEALRQEVARLRKRHVLAIEAMRRPAEPVYMARCARAAAGRVLLGSAIMLVLVGLSMLALEAWTEVSPWNGDALTAMLVASWPAAALAYVTARACARRRFVQRLMAPIAITCDVHADLERARRFDPGQHAMRILASMEAASLAPLLAGIGLLLPLSSHFLVAVALRDTQAGIDFDFWIAMSAVLVGHCHLILAVRAWRYARQLGRVATMSLVDRAYGQGWKTYGIVLASSLFPGVLLLCAPVVLVAVTGLFVPLMYGWAGKRLVAERDALAMTTFRALAAVTDR